LAVDANLDHRCARLFRRADGAGNVSLADGRGTAAHGSALTGAILLLLGLLFCRLDGAAAEVSEL
jgi:hypothetical protein